MQHLLTDKITKVGRRGTRSFNLGKWPLEVVRKSLSTGCPEVKRYRKVYSTNFNLLVKTFVLYFTFDWLIRIYRRYQNIHHNYIHKLQSFSGPNRWSLCVNTTIRSTLIEDKSHSLNQPTVSLISVPIAKDSIINTYQNSVWLVSVTPMIVGCFPIKYPEHIVRVWLINFYPREDYESLYRKLVRTDYSLQ